MTELELKAVSTVVEERNRYRAEARGLKKKRARLRANLSRIASAFHSDQVQDLAKIATRALRDDDGRTRRQR